MKKFSIYFMVGFLLAACEPSIDCTNDCAGKRIRNIVNGSDYFKIVYNYDNQPEKYYKALKEFALFNYSPSSVEKVYQDTTSYYNFDADGRVIESETPLKNTKYMYEYDGFDQVIKTTEIKAGQTTIFNHTWHKGNLIKTTYNRPLGNISTTIEYEYDVSTKNSVQNLYLELNLLGSSVNNNIQSDYLGLNLTGKSSGNAIKKITKSFVDRLGGPAPAPIITVYQYKKDGCGCITSSTETVGSKTIIREYLYELVP